MTITSQIPTTVEIPRDSGSTTNNSNSPKKVQENEGMLLKKERYLSDMNIYFNFLSCVALFSHTALSESFVRTSEGKAKI
jgi:hypothetical protein